MPTGIIEVAGTPPATLTKARKIALSKGLRYVYTGNVHDVGGQSTYCHNCRKILIERDWYELGEYHIKGGKCEYCATACTGYFEDKPGDWGSKRLPVRMD